MLGYSREGGPLVIEGMTIGRELIAKVWAVRDAWRVLERMDPHDVPSDSYQWGLIVNHALHEAQQQRQDAAALSNDVVAKSAPGG